MPSQRFTDQSILFTVSLSHQWHLLGASGKFCLPHLRQQHHLGRSVDLKTQINTLERLLGAFYLWEGSLYVEYDTEHTLLTNPTNLEWSGVIRPAAPEEVSRYLLSQHADIGPIELPQPTP